MIDISKKFPTIRTAVASARVHMAAETVALIEANDLPKKDPLPVARWAAVQAAKRTSDLIPACHPVPIDFVGVEFEIQHNASVIDITTTVRAEYKTGVEMEALTAASIAALTLYDMLKPVDETISISAIQLVSKSGGLHGAKSGVSVGSFRAAVVVISDSSAQGERKDVSGSAACEILTDLGFTVDGKLVVPDEPEEITAVITSLCDQPVDLVITTGGTGLGPRDSTDRTLKELLEREAPGIAEWIRAYGRTRTPRAVLSNGISGIRNGTLVISLPGSTNAVKESLEALKPTLMHALRMMKGEGH